MWKSLRAGLTLFVLLSLLTGLAYPLLVTAVGQVLFPAKANGSLIVENGKVVGSEWIGQSFSDPAWFWGRPSATSPMPNNAMASSGSNQASSNPALQSAIAERVTALRQADPTQQANIPVDLVTASASGLDPHISPAAARYQAARVARARGLALDRVEALVAAHVEGRDWGLFGEPRVNVLRLNLALAKLR